MPYHNRHCTLFLFVVLLALVWVPETGASTPYRRPPTKTSKKLTTTTTTTTTSTVAWTTVFLPPPVLIGTGTPNPPRVVYSGSRCGEENNGNICGGGSCCSSKGWCGKDVRYCGGGCRQGYGLCWSSTTANAPPASPPPSTTTRTTTGWATPSLLPEPFQTASQRSDCLLAHNEVRRNLPNGVQIPDLVYNTTLERLACYWSRYLADTRRFDHSSGQVGNSGENLYRSSQNPPKGLGLTGPEIGSCRPAVTSWAAEEKYYQPGWKVGVDGVFSQYGHYTQIVWKNTRQIGCCAAQSPSGVDIVWTCHYSPRGNYKNQAAY